ncbi:MAG TPA: hybrid sensor histidine kinase/response regulator [Desulfobacterales bacterium]|nr:hybrid sensor histidine kinase/response regulator [Desulfobacterales bacterium]
MKSSTGSSRAFEPSKAYVKSREFNWKIVSRITPATLYENPKRLLYKLFLWDGVPLVIFTVVSWLLSYASIKRKLAEVALHKAHDELEIKVEERTADLTEANVLLNQEIKEHKQTEEALKESERRLSKAQRIAHIGNWELNLITNELFWSDEVYRLFGLKPQQFGASYEAFLDNIHPDDRDLVNKAYTDSLKNKIPYQIVHRLLLKDKTVKYVTEMCETFYDDSGEPILSVGTIQDITEQKNLEAQLLQSQKMEAIGKLSGGVAHDFNNLLTSITGNAELLSMKLQKDSPLKEYAKEISKASDRAASLTRQLLAFSRKQVLQPKVMSLNGAILDMEKMLRRLIGEDIDLKTTLSDELGNVEADPGQVEQVILNLCVNARDAMPRGGKITIETANVELDESYTRTHRTVIPGPYVMMAISDDGSGMDKETQSRIFDPFFTTKERGKGTGLGLSTVYGIVKQSEGNIWVYSEPGKGTTFKIYLPRVEKSVEKIVKTKEPVKSLTGTETVLVVEDDGMVRKLAHKVLKDYGYKVLVAENGKEGLKICEENKGPIHLMLTDVVMPEMGGRKLADHLKDLRPEIKVLYMSGYTDNTIVHHGILDKGMNFIQKPFTPETLAAKVRGMLEEK